MSDGSWFIDLGKCLNLCFLEITATPYEMGYALDIVKTIHNHNRLQHLKLVISAEFIRSSLSLDQCLDWNWESFGEQVLRISSGKKFELELCIQYELPRWTEDECKQVLQKIVDLAFVQCRSTPPLSINFLVIPIQPARVIIIHECTFLSSADQVQPKTRLV